MDHTDQARRNYRAYGVLRDAKLHDWATTTLFYTALHLVDAYMTARLGTAPDSHRTRAIWLSRLDVPLCVCVAYDELRASSHEARYEDWTSTIDADYVAALHDGAYRLVCEHFEAPDAILPD